MEQGLQALWDAFIATSVLLSIFFLLLFFAALAYLTYEWAWGRYYLWRRRDPFTKELIARRKADRR